MELPSLSLTCCWKEKISAINFVYRCKRSERGQVDLESSFIRKCLCKERTTIMNFSKDLVDALVHLPQVKSDGLDRLLNQTSLELYDDRRSYFMKLGMQTHPINASLISPTISHAATWSVQPPLQPKHPQHQHQACRPLYIFLL